MNSKTNDVCPGVYVSGDVLESHSIIEDNNITNALHLFENEIKRMEYIIGNLNAKLNRLISPSSSEIYDIGCEVEEIEPIYMIDKLFDEIKILGNSISILSSLDERLGRFVGVSNEKNYIEDLIKIL